MISDTISKLRKKVDVTRSEIGTVMADILSGNTSDAQNLDFLSYLAAKGETDDELLGMLEKMREFALQVRPTNNGTVIDMCGTGGDGLSTFNVSTAASFVVAAAGGIVAKHGNRSSSGASGSADIFEYFGYDFNQSPAKAAAILQKHNICFMFAQRYHPAMKHVSAARLQLKKRTAFNILGPLSNPAGVQNQLVGVSATEYLERLPLILKRGGAYNVMTVRSDNGMDELSTSSTNKVCILRDDGKMTTSTIDPETVGLHRSRLQDIQIQTRRDAITSFVGVLDGTASEAMIETVALNAAAGLIVANVSRDFEDAIPLALDTIHDGRAFKLLDAFVDDTGDVSRLREVMTSI